MSAQAWSGSVARALAVGFLAVVCTVSAIADGTGSFTAVGTMLSQHDAATAALLDDGTVLLAGNGESSRAAELFDPVAGTFSPTGDLNEIRSAAATIALSDGRALVVGGWNGAVALPTAEVYDPVTRRFSALPAAMATARIAPSLTRLDDGRVLIAGGHDGSAPTASAELYDSVANRFVPTENMGTARSTSAVLLNDGSVLFAGGEITGGRATSSAEVYDPVGGSFTPTGALAMARRGHQATRLADGRVLITGGFDNTDTAIADAEVYDPADRAFHPAGRMPTARGLHRAVLLASGDVLTFGGQDANGPLSSAERYDPATGTFTPVAGLGEPRSAPAVASLADGRVFVAGGRDLAGQLLRSAETYRDIPPQATWTILSSSRSASAYGDAISYNARVAGPAAVSSGTVRFFDGGAILLGTAPVGPLGSATLTTQMTPAGMRLISAVYHGSPTSHGSTSPALTQAVSKKPVASALTIAPVTQAYSDVVKFEATISGAYGDAPAQGAVFKVGTQSMSAEPVPMEKSGDGAWKATLSTQLLETSPAGQLRPDGMTKRVTASFTGVSQNYSVSAPIAKALMIVKEDARVKYDGPPAVQTAKGKSTATIHLKATVTDIAMTLDNNGDKNAGDIQLARVTFTNRATGAVIATVNVSATDPKNTTGVAEFDWSVDNGTTKVKSYRVGLMVSNYYTRNSTGDDATIVVTKQ